MQTGPSEPKRRPPMTSRCVLMMRTKILRRTIAAVDVHRHPKSGQRLGGLAHASLEGVLNVVGGSM